MPRVIFQPIKEETAETKLSVIQRQRIRRGREKIKGTESNPCITLTANAMIPDKERTTRALNNTLALTKYIRSINLISAQGLSPFQRLSAWSAYPYVWSSHTEAPWNSDQTQQKRATPFFSCKSPREPMDSRLLLGTALHTISWPVLWSVQTDVKAVTTLCMINSRTAGHKMRKARLPGDRKSLWTVGWVNFPKVGILTWTRVKQCISTLSFDLKVNLNLSHILRYYKLDLLSPQFVRLPMSDLLPVYIIHLNSSIFISGFIYFINLQEQQTIYTIKSPKTANRLHLLNFCL